MYLRFNVESQHLTRTDRSIVVARSENYLKAKFDFSPDWDGVTKTAVFTNGGRVYNVILDNDECFVPTEVIRKGCFTVSVFGGDLITADVVTIRVEPSGYEVGGSPEPPTPEVYEQVLGMFDKFRGGEEGQVLSKSSDEDLEFEWVNQGGGGGGATPRWGNIEGTLSNQTDLQEALNAKQNAADAFDGDYNNLTNKPSLFSGDYNDLTNKPSLFSGDYDDLTDKPDIPTIVANPTLTGTEENLDGIEINNSKFKIPKVIDTDYEDVDITVNDNTYWNVEENVVVYTELTSQQEYKAISAIPLALGEEYHIEINVGPSSKTAFMTIVNENYEKVEEITRNMANSFVSRFVRDIRVTSPNMKFLLLTAYGSTPIIVRKKVFWTENILKGKYVSILGDSFSAMAGTLPAGYERYYDGNHYGVACKEQVWWNMVANALDMNVLVNNSWSGSIIAEDSRETKISGSDVRRCEALGDSSHNPDLILVAMGGNDFSRDVTLGDYDGTTALNDDVTTYRTAYTTMLKRIKTKYPNALVVCLTPWFMERGTDTGFTYINTNNDTLYDFIKASEDIAKMCNCPVIDVYSLFSKTNYTPTYCQDGSATPTHPNALGQKVIANKVINELKRIAIESTANA